VPVPPAGLRERIPAREGGDKREPIALQRNCGNVRFHQLRRAFRENTKDALKTKSAQSGTGLYNLAMATDSDAVPRMCCSTGQPTGSPQRGENGAPMSTWDPPFSPRCSSSKSVAIAKLYKPVPSIAQRSLCRSLWAS
jgi:hypothetical protein